MHKVTTSTCVMNAPSVLGRKAHGEILIAIPNSEHTCTAATFEMHAGKGAAVRVIAEHITLPPTLIEQIVHGKHGMRRISWIPEDRTTRERFHARATPSIKKA